MAHGVELEVAEGDSLHLAIGGMIADAVLVATEAVARLQHRRILVGNTRKLVQPAAGQRAKAREMRLKLGPDAGREIELQQTAKGAVDFIEIGARRLLREGRRGWCTHVAPTGSFDVHKPTSSAQHPERQY
jgi:hypothetical protein